MIELGAGADEARGPAAAGPAYVRAGKQRAGDAAAPRGGEPDRLRSRHSEHMPATSNGLHGQIFVAIPTVA